MPTEMLVALDVHDDAQYTAYRAGMTPILERFGGGFGYDFRVSEVLRAEAPGRWNRVFTIHFPDGAGRDAFFADPEYLAVRERHFEGAVTDTAIIATYERD